METIFVTKCPYCNTPNCYNSGFTVECVNIHCNFYSKDQHTLVLQHIEEKRKKYVAEIKTLATANEDSKTKEFEDDEDLNHYGYGAWFGPRI